MAVRKALGEHVNDSTVFIVAQRVSTILSADQILVLDEGTIVGKGTHKELIQTCEEYRQIAESQLSPSEIAASLGTTPEEKALGEVDLTGTDLIKDESVDTDSERQV